MSQCTVCKKELTTLVKLTSKLEERPLSRTEVCTNPECPMKIDIEKVKTWRRKTPKIYS